METASGLGAFLRSQRNKAGLTQKQLVAKSGVPQATISDIERGTNKLPGADYRRRLAAALNLRHVDILIAAGELNEDELPKEGAPREVFAGDPVKAQAVRLLAGLNDEFVRAGCLFLDHLRDTQEKNAGLAANNDSSTVSTDSPSPANQVSPISEGNDKTRRPSS